MRNSTNHWARLVNISLVVNNELDVKNCAEHFDRLRGIIINLRI